MTWTPSNASTRSIDQRKRKSPLEWHKRRDGIRSPGTRLDRCSLIEIVSAGRIFSELLAKQSNRLLK